MPITFYKYQGTGNDFIFIDNRTLSFDTNDVARISKLCDRKFGIGADGLILLQEEEGFDFRMVYFNSDGRESSMCGNGGRCVAKFAKLLGLTNDSTRFIAIDGEHEAVIHDEIVALKIRDVDKVELGDNFGIIDTGSPHYLTFVNNIEDVDIITEARKIRYNERFKDEGININFIEVKDDALHVRTYERGVENETLSCGTGMVAAALYASANGKLVASECNIHTPGGEARVRFDKNNHNGYSDIWLEGPAELTFKGEIDG